MFFYFVLYADILSEISAALYYQSVVIRSVCECACVCPYLYLDCLLACLFFPLELLLRFCCVDSHFFRFSVVLLLLLRWHINNWPYIRFEAPVEPRQLVEPCVNGVSAQMQKDFGDRQRRQRQQWQRESRGEREYSLSKCF